MFVAMATNARQRKEAKRAKQRLVNRERALRGWRPPACRNWTFRADLKAVAEGARVADLGSPALRERESGKKRSKFSLHGLSQEAADGTLDERMQREPRGSR